MLCNIVSFYGKEFLAICQNPKLEDHLLSKVHCYLRSKPFADENRHSASKEIVFYRNSKFSTTFKNIPPLHTIQSYFQFTPHPHNLFESRSILILPCHLTAVLSSGPFHSQSSTSILHSFFLYFMLLKCPALLNCLQCRHNMHLTSIPMGRSQIRNLRTVHAVVIGTRLSRLRKTFQSPNRP